MPSCSGVVRNLVRGWRDGVAVGFHGHHGHCHIAGPSVLRAADVAERLCFS